jgi:hypothetical protein
MTSEVRKCRHPRGGVAIEQTLRSVEVFRPGANAAITVPPNLGYLQLDCDEFSARFAPCLHKARKRPAWRIAVRIREDRAIELAVIVLPLRLRMVGEILAKN